jgi:hypothetical protein
MRSLPIVRAALAVACLVTLPAPARAQMYELIGTRAQGMAGAFVAVSDDATATWWNPAGLASGSYGSLVFERGETTDPERFPPGGPAAQGSVTGFSMAFPAMALSYYRLRLNELHPISPTADELAGRQEEGATGVDLRAVSISEYGVTVGQSLGQHLVLATTVKLMRGGLTAAGVAGLDDGFDRVDELEIDSETEPDLDVGVMASAGSLRLGLSLKHLREPSFGEGLGELELKRQARAGLAILMGQSGPMALTLAFDADLTRTRTPVGEVRHVAGGIEAWLFQRRMALRGGVSADTLGELTTSTSAGASLSLGRGLYVQGAATFGSDESREGWSLGLGVTF